MALGFISAVPGLLGPSNSCEFSKTPVRSTPVYSFVSRRSRNVFSSTPSSRTMFRMATSNNSTEPTRKELVQLYGGSYLVTSFAISVISYAVLYGIIYVGIDVRSLMNATGDWLATTPLGRPSALDNFSDTASTAALAYIAHKVMSPLRFPITIAATPLVAKTFFDWNGRSDKSS